MTAHDAADVLAELRAEVDRHLIEQPQELVSLDMLNYLAGEMAAFKVVLRAIDRRIEALCLANGARPTPEVRYLEEADYPERFRR